METTFYGVRFVTHAGLYDQSDDSPTFMTQAQIDHYNKRDGRFGEWKKIPGRYFKEEIFHDVNIEDLKNGTD